MSLTKISNEGGESSTARKQSAVSVSIPPDVTAHKLAVRPVGVDGYKPAVSGWIISANEDWLHMEHLYQTMLGEQTEENMLKNFVIFNNFPELHLYIVFNSSREKLIKYHVDDNTGKIYSELFNVYLHEFKKIVLSKINELRPRWAEENRPKKQVKLRLEPDLIAKLDRAAENEQITRNDWIERAILNKLDNI